MNNAGSSWFSSKLPWIDPTTWWLNKQKKAKDLRQQISLISASSVLDDAGIDDAQVLTLTREDLLELFPGIRNFQLRRAIMTLITDTVKDSLKTGPETFSGALKNLMHENNSNDAVVQDVLKETLRVFREMEEQLKAAQESLKPYIEILNSLNEARKEDWNPAATSSRRKCPNSFQSDLKSPTTMNTPLQPSVKVYPLVCGKTLGADRQILAQLRGVSVSELQDCQLILVFCPVASRAGTDAEDAIRKIPADKPAVLVMMYHTFDPNYVCPSLNTSQARLVQQVNMLFHDSSLGLLNCPANEQAMLKLQYALNM